ncbi:MAG TPA: AGE family epimerase/isomerase [Geminicoccaceae bacterium]|nr:AGE family epimerase/isomerase [Geminicoccaceae bacterium]
MQRPRRRRRVAPGVPHRPAESRAVDPRVAGPVLEHLLNANLLPFWRRVLEPAADGGFALGHDILGRPLHAPRRRLVAQARALWFLSRLLRSGRGDARDRRRADAGFAFLVERLWDPEEGGFWWEIDVRRRAASAPAKQLYGHAFALFAIAEYALATGSGAAAEEAVRIFGLLEERFHDRVHGGYFEFFERDWRSPAAGAADHLGGPADGKLANSHLHLLEAFATLAELSREPLVRERLAEVVAILTGLALRRPHLTLADRHRPDWQALAPADHEPVSYGHDLELVHLLIAADRIGGCVAPSRVQLLSAVFAGAVRWGEDRRLGGFHAAGPPGAPADDRRKVWWVQAEALLAAIELYRLTADPDHLACFLRTLDWIAGRQADREHGEWFEEIEPDGHARGPKAGAWKCPYHTGRALLASLDSLAASGAAAPGEA